MIAVAIGFALGLPLLVAGLWRPRWLLFAFVFLSPTVPINVGYSLQGSEGMTLSPTRILAGFFVLALIIRAIWRRAIPTRFPLAVPFLLYIGVRVAGLWLAPDKTGGVVLLAGEYGVLTAVLSYGGFAVIRRARDLDRLLGILLVAGVVAGLIGLWEWTTGGYFEATSLVRMFRSVAPIREDIAIKADGLARITGPLAHSLILAGLMAFLVPIAMQRAIWRRRSGRVLQYLAGLLLIPPLILTFGRAALAMTVCETLAVLMLYRQKRALPISLAVAVAAMSVLPVYARYRGPGETTSLLVPAVQAKMFVERYGLLAEDYRETPAAALVGFGTSRWNLSEVAPLGEQSWRWSVIDSDFIRILGTTGALGFATWLGLFVSFLFQLWRSVRARRRVVWGTAVGAVGVGVVGAIVQAIPGVSILTYTQTWPVVAICMGASLGVLHEDRRQAVAAQPDVPVEIPE